MTTEELLNDKFEVAILEKNLISFRNALRYAGYLIYHNDTAFLRQDRFSYVHENYDGPGDKRLGNAESIEKCIEEINDYLLNQ